MRSQNLKPQMLEFLDAGQVHSTFDWGSDPQTLWFQDPFTSKLSEDPVGLGGLYRLIFTALEIKVESFVKYLFFHSLKITIYQLHVNKNNIFL